jgi:hypothetical protein
MGLELEIKELIDEESAKYPKATAGAMREDFASMFALLEARVDGIEKGIMLLARRFDEYGPSDQTRG